MTSSSVLSLLLAVIWAVHHCKRGELASCLPACLPACPVLAVINYGRQKL